MITPRGATAAAEPVITEHGECPIKRRRRVVEGPQEKPSQAGERLP